MLPEAIPTFIGWEPYKIPGPNKVLILSDVHVPFHDEQALQLALKGSKPDIILLNGDQIDFYSVSRWEREPTTGLLQKEITLTGKFLKYLRSRFPKAEIIWKDGNHEERWCKFLSSKAPELHGLECLQFPALFNFHNLGIHYVTDKKPILLGKLPVLHGHEYNFPIQNPVNPARGLFLKAKTSAMCGHMHTTSSHAEKTLLGEIHSTFSVGCLCNMLYRYSPINNHNHGFARVDIANDNGFHVNNYKVIRGKVVH